MGPFERVAFTGSRKRNGKGDPASPRKNGFVFSFKSKGEPRGPMHDEEVRKLKAAGLLKFREDQKKKEGEQN